MIDFDLGSAHPDYQSLIEQTLTKLAERYPLAKPKLVALYGPDKNDLSMATVTKKSSICLSAYWFTKPPEVLRSESKKGGDWHGGMLEPEHVIHHEAGHVVADNVPGWREWATPRWKVATADEAWRVTGYALANPDEFWAECFAGVCLGLDHPRCAEMADFLGLKI